MEYNPEPKWGLTWGGKSDYPSWFVTVPPVKVCLYDTYEFDHEAVFIPWTDDWSAPHGCFCSLECAHAYLARDFSLRTRIHRRFMWMTHKYYGKSHLAARLPWQQLQRFQGERGISIEEWRNATEQTWYVPFFSFCSEDKH